MTENLATQPTPDATNVQPPSQSAKTKAQPPPGDWFLEFLANLVNDSDLEIGLSLNMGGIIVSGILVGGRQYFDGIAKEAREAIPPNVPGKLVIDSLADGFEKFKELYVPKPQGPDQEPRLPPVAYLHFKNARMFHPGGAPIPQNRAVWWRGRIDSVDGFIIGNLT